MKIQQFTNTKNIKTSLAIAAGVLAIGAVSAISAAPAEAITFTTGELDFGVSTSAFSTLLTPVSGNNFNVTFDPGFQASIVNPPTSPLLSFSPTFALGPVATDNPTVNFSYVSGSTYNLSQDLVLNFSSTTPTSFTLKKDSKFTGTEIFGLVNGVNTKIGAGLQLSTNNGSFFLNGGNTTNVPTLSFSLNDTGAPSGGLYISQATPAAPVPEPFTIIGSIIGGAAALRMKKKMSKSVED